MKTLNANEINAVSGGNAIVIAAIGMAGAVLAFAYQVGADMAARDNNLSCPAE